MSVRFVHQSCCFLAGWGKVVKCWAGYHLHPTVSHMLRLHFTSHTTVQCPPALWLINYPQNALDTRMKPKSPGFLYCTATRCAFINTEMKLGGGEGGQHFTSSYLKIHIYFRLCLMPSKVGSFAISTSAWLKILSSDFQSKGSEVWEDLDHLFCW